MVGCIRYLKKGQLILRSCSSSKSYNELAIVLKDQSPVETHVKVFVIGKESGTKMWVPNRKDRKIMIIDP